MSTQSGARAAAPSATTAANGTTTFTWAGIVEITLPESGKLAASYQPGETGQQSLAVMRGGSPANKINAGLNSIVVEAGDVIVIVPTDATGMTLSYFYD